ncbi:hypothetical protein K438DRAFT_1575714 [Mycena galopus ATCC 62051]|nr:hypothetical protein K438DRAFT_1575714 [Mycena galopus ATCC 62051]
MFNCPGVLLCNGTQCYFTKAINCLKSRPKRKSTEGNLDRIRCCIKDAFDYTPTDKAIWKSIRSRDIQRSTRNFLWKFIHNIFRVGDFWQHIENLEILGRCPHCKVDESLEHIMLDCDVLGQHQIWRLCAEIWALKYGYLDWPKLNWGLLLGCNLTKFRTRGGKILASKQRLFSILINTSMHLIWKLRNKYRFDMDADELPSQTEIHNRWIAAINMALKRDILSTNKIHLSRLAFKRQTVLNTWSGTLWDEDSLPDDWIKSDRVLVGI